MSEYIKVESKIWLDEVSPKLASNAQNEKKTIEEALRKDIPSDVRAYISEADMQKLVNTVAKWARDIGQSLRSASDTQNNASDKYLWSADDVLKTKVAEYNLKITSEIRNLWENAWAQIWDLQTQLEGLASNAQGETMRKADLNLQKRTN